MQQSFDYTINNKDDPIDNLLINEQRALDLTDSNLKFYHGGLEKNQSEKTLIEYKRKHQSSLSRPFSGLFLIRDESSENENYILSILDENHEFHHIKIEHVQDAYFRLFPDGRLIHGLDTLIEKFSISQSFLPCKLKDFVIGSLPPNSSRRFGITIALHKIAINGSVDLLTQVITSQNCPQINIKDSTGRTALHSACFIGNKEKVKLLLEYGASANIRDKDGNTGLHICCSNDHSDLLDLLITDYDSEINDRNPENSWTPLHTAAFYNSTKVISNLANKFCAILNIKTKNNETPLDLARKANSFESIRLIESLQRENFSLSSHEDWLHEDILYSEAVALLDSVGRIDGLFLLIKNKIHKNNFNLIFYFNEHLNNFEIVLGEKGYQIGFEPHFKSIEYLIDFYSKNKSNLPCCLTKSLNKKGILICEILNRRKMSSSFANLKADITGCSSLRLTTKSEINRTKSFISSYLNKESNQNSIVKRNSFRLEDFSSLSSSFDTTKNESNKNNSLRIGLTNNQIFSESNKMTRECVQDASSSLQNVKLNSISVFNLEIISKIGEGEFGFVYEAKYEKSPNLTIPVAIKHLKSNVKSNEFFQEVEIMSSLSHPCIVKFHGVCYEQKMIVLELVQMGSLDKFLKNRKSQINVDLMKLWTAQIAHGMMYLELKKLIHRDLASRNVLVSSFLQVKITDFGMTRNLDSNDVYIQNPSNKVPFRWYPPEALEFNIFTTKSDVWSFGVTIWEIFSYGESPYGNLNCFQVFNMLKQGTRLTCPLSCARSIFNLLLDCWRIKDEKRPSFIEIVKFINRNYEFDSIRHLLVDFNST